MECVRCGSSIETMEELCSSCSDLINKASELIEENGEVKKFYETILKEQKKAKARLTILYNRQENDKNNFIKKTGRGIVKFYNFSILDIAISSFKKIMQKDEPKKNEEELLLEEIVILEEFINIDPIEFVVDEYLIPKEETEKRKNVFVEVANETLVKNFLELDQKKQYRISITIIVLSAILLILISFFLRKI